MVIETYNVSGWGSLKPYLAKTAAHVVLVQESHLLGEKADEASQIARRCGWKSVQAQALPGEGAGTSGGVMILVRSWVGICYPDYIGHVVVPGRVVAARVDYPGFPPFVAISAYLVSGAGLAAENLEI